MKAWVQLFSSSFILELEKAYYLIFSFSVPVICMVLVCSYMGTCHVCIWVFQYSCMCTCGSQRSMSSVYLDWSPPNFLSQSLTEPGAHGLARMAGQRGAGSACL